MEAMVDNLDTRSERKGILPSDGAKCRSSEQPVCELTPKGREQGVCFLAPEPLHELAQTSERDIESRRN